MRWGQAWGHLLVSLSPVPCPLSLGGPRPTPGGVDLSRFTVIRCALAPRFMLSGHRRSMTASRRSTPQGFEPLNSTLEIRVDSVRLHRIRVTGHHMVRLSRLLDWLIGDYNPATRRWAGGVLEAEIDAEGHGGLRGEDVVDALISSLWGSYGHHYNTEDDHETPDNE